MISCFGIMMGMCTQCGMKEQGSHEQFSVDGNNFITSDAKNFMTIASHAPFIVMEAGGSNFITLNSKIFTVKE